MAMKMHVKKGDQVRVLSGVDAGKTGKILEVRPKEGRVLVEGVNIIKRHTKPSRQNPQGGVVEQPGPIYSSKLAVICPSCNEPTRVGHRRTDDGKSVRVCRKCDKAID